MRFFISIGDAQRHGSSLLLSTYVASMSTHQSTLRLSNIIAMSNVSVMLKVHFEKIYFIVVCKSAHIIIIFIFLCRSPIRSLIESGFGESEKIDVSLFYGVRNLQRMAYQERFKDWESRGIQIIPVLSRPDDQWTGQRGYVQNAFSREKKVINPSSTGAILCGHKQMTEEITRALVADGMSKDKILTNF